MIRIRDLEKSYRRGDESVVACAVAALDIADGEQVALIGRSGLGKSTLMNLIAGILLPDRGTIEVAGTRIDQLSEAQRDRFRARHIGMVFQTFNLLQPFTALENVLLGAVFSQGTGHGVEAQAKELLARVGLGERMHHRPNQLSVGQAQRVSICRALIHDPELILADEPLGNQDKTTGREVLAQLIALAREKNRTVLMVTHDPESAAAMQRTLDLAQLRAAAS